MTVALAALCGWPNDVMVVAAADQMITSGDIQFEQPQPKMYRLRENCIAMIYGLSAAQAQICSEVEEYAASKAVTEVKAISGVYGRLLGDYVRKRAEADILQPLGLTSFDLIRRPPTVNASQTRVLSQQMQSYFDRTELADDLGGVIIAGVDATGGHIYGVEYGRVICYDSIGFVAAGGGQWHANSQFMFAGYTRTWDFTDALSLLYAAKKRAEVAPGVGVHTDIVILTTRPPNLIHMRPGSELVTELDRIYVEHKKKIDDDLASQHTSVKVLFHNLIQKWSADEPAMETSPAAAPAPTPTDDLEVRPTQRPRRRDRKAPPPSRE